MTNGSDPTGHQAAVVITAERVSTELVAYSGLDPDDTAWVAARAAIDAIPGVMVSAHDGGYELSVRADADFDWSVVEAAITDAATANGHPQVEIKRTVFRDGPRLRKR